MASWPHRSRRAHLEVETLEDRTVPASLGGAPYFSLVHPLASKTATMTGPAPNRQLTSTDTHAVANPSLNRGRMFRDATRDSFQDPAKFHALMRTVYGDAYDRARAEQIRRMVLEGDDGFLPRVQWLDRESLHGGN